MREINVAVVGCGFVADGHIKAWRKVPQARIVAVCDLNEATARSTAEFWGIPKYYTSLSELTKRSNINLVDICTPPQAHADLAVQAMKSGFDVLIEKPMTMTVEDAERIVECKKETGTYAGVLHNWLFDAPVLEADSAMKKGQLGEIMNVEVEAISTKYDSMAADRHHWCHSLPGGRFSEMLAHPIYLIRHFLGEPEIGEVQVSKLGEYEWMKSDEICVTFNVGEKLGRAYASFNAPRKAIFISLYGREAILKLDIINSTKIILPRRETTRFSRGFDSFRQATQLMHSTVKNIARIGFGRWLSGHEMCIKLFAQSLIEGSEPPVTIDEGYRVIKTLEEICERIKQTEKNKSKQQPTKKHE